MRIFLYHNSYNLIELLYYFLYMTELININWVTEILLIKHQYK